MALPRIQILLAFKDYLAAQIAALPEADRFTIRHHRHRSTHTDEMPCVSIRLVSDDTTGISSGSDSQPSLAELVMELAVDLIAECELPAEADDDDTPPAPEDDPTGLAVPSAMIGACLSTLFTDGEPAQDLGGLLWDIRWEGTGNDEESSPDAACMVERLVLVYRVRADNPTEILTGN